MNGPTRIVPAAVVAVNVGGPTGRLVYVGPIGGLPAFCRRVLAQHGASTVLASIPPEAEREGTGHVC